MFFLSECFVRFLCVLLTFWYFISGFTFHDFCCFADFYSENVQIFIFESHRTVFCVVITCRSSQINQSYSVQNVFSLPNLHEPWS